MNTKVCAMLLGVLVSVSALAATNAMPTVQVVSAGMRPGTSLMDVVYKITDSDDATVKVRALAFKDGTRSFANVIRPTAWAENTQTNIGDSITTGVNHTLTWDVRADWNIDLANVKFEVLCQDCRGLLPFDWITIPATTNTPAVTISLNVPTDAQVLDALFWLYAGADAQLVLTNGNPTGTAASGLFNGVALTQYDVAITFIYKQMNLARATGREKNMAISARAGVSDPAALFAANRPWNESVLGMDSTAVTTNVVNTRWVKLTYADGAITMSDRFSGLMWIYNVGAIGRMNWNTANAYCENLVYAGHDDWFLPSSGTLQFMCSQKGLFTGVQANTYWTSSLIAGNGAWQVGMYDSAYVNGTPQTSPAYVWPVRGGQ